MGRREDNCLETGVPKCNLGTRGKMGVRSAESGPALCEKPEDWTYQDEIVANRFE